ncbi:MAG: GAF domain-containing sensor histidine kinase, partial [Sulfitobacter sp.]|nr:GAF domain-containing sensor histidine kinase [Sulfitobacter sp.]
DAPLILTDTREHPEFSDHPAVVSAPNVRFYAGAPIVLTSGFRVGSLCALDLEPHEVPPSEAVEELKQLAIQIADYLEGKHAERSAGNLETRARIASDAQLEFLSLVGHELRTPLTILLGNARLLRSRLSDEVDTRMVKAIESSGGHLHQLIEHIIRYSNLDSGERTLAEEAISCIDLLRSAASPVEPIAAAADRQLDVECKEGIDTIYADGEQITLALSCLITNAVKHGGGAIEVVAETAGDGTLRLAVFDEGDGLPDRQLSEMEGAFVIGEDLDTRHAGGLGLGLPLAKKIAQLHGGALITGTEGSRTLVEIRLPSWRRRSRMA